MGLRGGRAATAALVCLACAAGGFGASRQLQGGALVIERGATQQEDVAAKDLPAPDEPQQTETESVTCVVHVDGAVAAPGVVVLEGSDLRVLDAVDAVGGLSDDADTTGINLAEPLIDGSKVHIPREGEDAFDAGSLPAGQSTTSGATGDGQATVLVNLNTASVDELQTLPGIGEVTARAIIEDREANGPFATTEDLMRVSGIGEKKFARLRSGICV